MLSNLVKLCVILDNLCKHHGVEILILMAFCVKCGRVRQRYTELNTDVFRNRCWWVWQTDGQTWTDYHKMPKKIPKHVRAMDSVQMSMLGRTHPSYNNTTIINKGVDTAATSLQQCVNAFVNKAAIKRRIRCSEGRSSLHTWERCTGTLGRWWSEEWSAWCYAMCWSTLGRRTPPDGVMTWRVVRRRNARCPWC